MPNPTFDPKKKEAMMQLLKERKNPECPFCGCRVTHKRGVTKGGSQRFLCKGCRRSFQNDVVYRLDHKKAEHLYNAIYYYLFSKQFLSTFFELSMSHINALVRQHRDHLISEGKPYFTNDYHLIDPLTDREVKRPFHDEFTKRIKTIPVLDEDSGFTDKKEVYLYQQRRPGVQMEPTPLYEPVSRKEAFTNNNMQPPEVDPALDKILDRKLGQDIVNYVESGEGMPIMKYNPDGSVVGKEEEVW